VKYNEKKRQERKERRQRATQDLTSSSRLTDENDDSMDDSFSDSDDSTDSLFAPFSMFRSEIAEGSMVDTKGLRHDYKDIIRDVGNHFWSM